MRLIPVITLLLVRFLLTGQDYQTRIYRAYLRGDMDAWVTLMDRMEAECERSGDMGLLQTLADTRYGYVAYCLNTKKMDQAEKVLELAEREVALILRSRPGDPRALSLRGALYGYRVRLEPLKAPRYGRKSVETNQKAIRLGPREPRAWMEKANIEFYKPAIFGGSRKEAVPLYEKAIRLFESNSERTRENWIYLNCLVGLAGAYDETGQLKRAGEVYRKILRLEPTFRWVRDDLYPGYLSRQSDE